MNCVFLFGLLCLFVCLCVGCVWGMCVCGRMFLGYVCARASGWVGVCACVRCVFLFVWVCVRVLFLFLWYIFVFCFCYFFVIVCLFVCCCCCCFCLFMYWMYQFYVNMVALLKWAMEWMMAYFLRFLPMKEDTSNNGTMFFLSIFFLNSRRYGMKVHEVTLYRIL